MPSLQEAFHKCSLSLLDSFIIICIIHIPPASCSQCLPQTIGEMGPHTQTSQKQKVQPHLGLGPGTHPINGHQGEMVPAILLASPVLGVGHTCWKKARKNYNAAIRSLASRVRSILESWSVSYRPLDK